MPGFLCQRANFHPVFSTRYRKHIRFYVLVQIPDNNNGVKIKKAPIPEAVN